MSEFAITGMGTSVNGPQRIDRGPYPDEDTAASELAALRDGGLIHRLHSTIYELTDEETAR